MKRIENLDGWTSGKTIERDLLNGLSRRQRTFILEKIMGRNDKDAALAAGYSLSMAGNTKQKVGSREYVLNFSD
jgi:phage terminase small subunit